MNAAAVYLFPVLMLLAVATSSWAFYQGGYARGYREGYIDGCKSDSRAGFGEIGAAGVAARGRKPLAED